MSGDGRGGLGAMITNLAGRGDNSDSTCIAANPEAIDEVCVDRYIAITLGQPYGYWVPPIHYCRTYVLWALLQCRR